MKKGQLNQFLFPMVKADGTVKTDLTLSEFLSAVTSGVAYQKWYGVNHGGSVLFTSGTLSAPLRAVSSGIFQAKVNEEESAYDQMLFKFSHPSAVQNMMFQLVVSDDTDMISQFSDVRSDIKSRVDLAVSDLKSFIGVGVPLSSDSLDDINTLTLAVTSAVESDLHSLMAVQLADLKSDIQGTRSDISGVRSFLSNMHSNILSVFIQTPEDVASQVVDQLGTLTFDTEALESQITGVSSRISDMHSDLASDIKSAILVGPTTVTLANGVHGGAAATLTLLRAAINNTTNGEIALDITNTGTGNAHAIRLNSTNAKGLAIGGAAVGVSIDGVKGLTVVGSGGSDIVGDITGTVGLTAAALASVNSQMDVALETTTHAEPTDVPAATASLKDKVGFLAMLARNKQTRLTSTNVATLYDAAGTTPVATASLVTGAEQSRDTWTDI